MQETVGVPDGSLEEGPEDEVSKLLKINTYEENLRISGKAPPTPLR